MVRKKKRKNKSEFWFVITIAFLMLTSTIGYLFKGGSGNKYNDFSFSATDDGRWISKIEGKNMVFYYHPSSIEGINVSGQIINKIKDSNMLYFTYDLDNIYRSDIAAINLEISNLLWNDFKIYSINGLTSENEFGIMIINCSNATAANPVVYYKRSNESSIGMDNNCITIKGKTETDFYILKERLLYGLYGVIE